MGKIRTFVGKTIPTPLKNILKEWYWRNKVHYIKLPYEKKAICALKGKKKIRVVFLALYKAVWKYDSLYQLMKADERFDPIVLVCPIVNYGVKHMLEQMEISFKHYKSLGYNVISSYNKDSDTYIDLEKDLQPDILFYTNPYKGLIDNRYYIDRFPNILTCYVPYGFNPVKFEWTYNLNFHNLLWRFFCETQITKEMIDKGSFTHGINCVVVGYPLYEKFCKEPIKNFGLWKEQEQKKKKIIWAPHHSLEDCGGLQLSTFLSYYKFFFELAQKYFNDIQIVFKPHPLLKEKLYQHPDWGKEKTDTYYKEWDSHPNTQLFEDDYIDLFKTSDAIIHDCGSFTTEYLYTQKPCMYLTNGHNLEQYNELGKQAFNCYYHGNNASDIISFIEKVIIKGEDTQIDARKDFFIRNLLPPNGLTAAENIINEIKKQIQ